ncbi:MAG: histidine ABC transporter permease [Devosia sp. 67-54]|uniref:ABC transporter permease subunit n=1 Tax=unclassified Devosia TaxID=196773 RepID=UPI00095FBCD7|nr:MULTISPECIES: ABC transporter permease subunit [unclassified Devosia]MBN9307638.1 ABC transporter permease subunit [Devosia sp.]OJX17444.1 MAG: histidine ABC transporter permease [Devosia sp. 67-54]
MTALDVLIGEVVRMAPAALFNIYFAVAAIPAGFGFAILLALGKNSPNQIVNRLSRAYIYFFRGSPFFIQLFAFYSLVLAFNLSTWKPLGIDGFVLHPLFLGPAILALNTTAYTAEIFYGALITVPRGEVEAARAYGMSRRQRFWSVTWPNLIRIAWPAYTNEVVFLFQATALVYFTLPVIGDQRDLMNLAEVLFQRDYNVFLHFGVAAGYFLVISFAIFYLFGLIYRRLMRHLPQERRLKFSWRRVQGLS